MYQRAIGVDSLVIYVNECASAFRGYIDNVLVYRIRRRHATVLGTASYTLPSRANTLRLGSPEARLDTPEFYAHHCLKLEMFTHCTIPKQAPRKSFFPSKR